MTFVLFQCRFSEKINLGLTIYVKFSHFTLKVNFSIFQKKLANIRYTLYKLFKFLLQNSVLLGRRYGFPQPTLQKVLKTM